MAEVSSKIRDASFMDLVKCCGYQMLSYSLKADGFLSYLYVRIEINKKPGLCLFMKLLVNTITITLGNRQVKVRNEITLFN